MSKRFAMTEPQRRFLVALLSGPMPVTSRACAEHRVATRQACKCAGWARLTGTGVDGAWELTDGGRWELAEIERQRNERRAA